MRALAVHVVHVHHRPDDVLDASRGLVDLLCLALVPAGLPHKVEDGARPLIDECMALMGLEDSVCNEKKVWSAQLLGSCFTFKIRSGE